MSKLMVTSIIIILSKLQFDVSSSNKTSQFVTSVPTYGRLHCKQCANMLKWFSVKWKGYSQHGMNMSFSTKTINQYSIEIWYLLYCLSIDVVCLEFYVPLEKKYCHRDVTITVEGIHFFTYARS